jgi:hypothetical protein
VRSGTTGIPNGYGRASRATATCFPILILKCGTIFLLHFVPFRYDHPWLIDRFPLDSFIRRGYIWHFNGLLKSLNRRIMQRTWVSIRHHHEGTDSVGIYTTSGTR